MSGVGDGWEFFCAVETKTDLMIGYHQESGRMTVMAICCPLFKLEINAARTGVVCQLCSKVYNHPALSSAIALFSISWRVPNGLNTEAIAGWVHAWTDIPKQDLLVTIS